MTDPSPPCYWPDGSQPTPSANYTSCSSSSGDPQQPAQCCAAGSVCLSNGLCFAPDEGDVYRGACTDRTFAADRCAGFCADVLSEDRARLSRCAADANGTLHWWCGDAARTPVCEAGPAGHFLQYPAASAIGVVGVAGTVMVANNGTSGAVGMMTQTSVTPTAAAAAATACGAAVRREAAARHTAVKVAVAMGVLLAVVVGFLGMLLWMERRRRRVAREAKPSPTSSSGSLMVEEAAVANTQRSVPRLAADGGGERPRGRLSVVEEAAEETSSPSRRLRRTSKFREERSPDPIGRAV